MGERADGRMGGIAREEPPIGPSTHPPILQSKSYSFWYGPKQALSDVGCEIPKHAITALIGPSGCGKTTFLRSINRMHDLTPGARHSGDILLDGGYGPRLNALVSARELPDRVERALRQAALWDEVQDRLREPGTALSGGQQQRLCIARALANEPEVLLMDEPCSALDPIATQRIEELLVELKQTYTIVIVTHNMQQAARVSDYTGFFYVGHLVEFGTTQQIFTRPTDERTEAYITGRFG